MKPSNQKRKHVLSIRVTDESKKILAGLRRANQQDGRKRWSNADSIELALQNIKTEKD